MIDYPTLKNYVDKGLPVFPVQISFDSIKGKFNKKPVAPWKEYQSRLPTDEELHEWGDAPKYNGLGMATGRLSGYVVLDAEVNATPEQLEGITSPMVVNTISGGKHYYYRWTKELQNNVRLSGKPLDFRGDGGFVCIPPTEYLDKKYSWNTRLLEPMYLQPLPLEIEKELSVRVITPLKIQTGSVMFPPAEVGERNEMAARYAGVIARSFPPKFLNYGWQALKDWNSTNSEPLQERELRTVWESITSREQKKPKTESVKPWKIYQGKQALDHLANLKGVYSEGITTGFPELDEFFTLLPQQLYLVSAATHVGKTMFCLNMASRIASLGYIVFFASLEQGVFPAKFVEKMLGGNYPESLSILDSDKLLNVDSLIQAAQDLEVRPDVLFVDHIHFLKKAGRGATEDIDEIVLRLQNAAKTLNVPIVTIAHTRKLNFDKVPEMDDLRDSSQLSQVPSVVMFLHRPRAENAEDSYLANNGVLLIPKNRIQGKTGLLKYYLFPTGEMRFQKRI